MKIPILSVGVLCVLPMLSAEAADSYTPLPSLKLTKGQVDVGIEKPFKVVHVSDSHIVRIDNRDTEEIRAYALKRSYMERKPGCYYFGDHFWGEHYLEEAVSLARQEGAVIVHTGGGKADSPIRPWNLSRTRSSTGLRRRSVLNDTVYRTQGDRHRRGLSEHGAVSHCGLKPKRGACLLGREKGWMSIFSPIPCR